MHDAQPSAALLAMKTLIYWFRNDLRLADNTAFTLCFLQAREQGLRLLPVFCQTPVETTRWGFARVGPHRQQILADTLADLDAQLRVYGSALLQLQGQVTIALPTLARVVQASGIVCEEIAAPQEQAEIAALQAVGLSVQTVWQSSLLDPATLPFEVTKLPAVFTQFRTSVENAGVRPRQPLPLPFATRSAAASAVPTALTPGAPTALPTAVPPWPAGLDADADWISHPELAPLIVANRPLALNNKGWIAMDFESRARSSFPYHLPAFQGGERAGLAHLRRYMAAKLPHTYKATRNQLSGTDYSSKFSPWLASGAISARTVFAQLMMFEAEAGANDGTYWLWFELLWRDYFRFLHLQYGVALYHARGLRSLDAANAAGAAQRNQRARSRSSTSKACYGSSEPNAPTLGWPAGPDASAGARANVSTANASNAANTSNVIKSANAEAFQDWCRGQTGEPLIDAAMRELHRSGYLSNRLRQVVASYLIYDLGGDWRAGAAWFESQLVDFDIYSNQGNWLYIAGLGTDPRGGRRFNLAKQTQDHDPDGRYRQLWLKA